MLAPPVALAVPAPSPLMPLRASHGGPVPSLWRSRRGAALSRCTWRPAVAVSLHSPAFPGPVQGFPVPWRPAVAVSLHSPAFPGAVSVNALAGFPGRPVAVLPWYPRPAVPVTACRSRLSRPKRSCWRPPVALAVPASMVSPSPARCSASRFHGGAATACRSRLSRPKRSCWRPPSLWRYRPRWSRRPRRGAALPGSMAASGCGVASLASFPRRRLR